MSHIYDQLTARDVLFERMIILYRAWRKVDSFLDQQVLEYVWMFSQLLARYLYFQQQVQR